MEELREHATLRVEDVMRTPDVPPLEATESVARALERAGASADSHLLVRYSTGRWAAISKQQLQGQAAHGSLDLPLREILSSSRLPILHPDQPLDDALGLVQDCPLVPVVSRADHRELEGVVSLSDILRVYRQPTGSEPGSKTRDT